jgi:hypothetical protein
MTYHRDQRCNYPFFKKSKKKKEKRKKKKEKRKKKKEKRKKCKLWLRMANPMGWG